MKPNEYTQQADAFLAKHGIKFTARLSDTKSPAWSEGKECGHHYRVTLSKCGGTRHYEGQCGHKWTAKPIQSATTRNLSGEQTQCCPICGKSQIFADAVRSSARITFDFWGSIADKRAGIQEITAYDVLACISSDAHCSEDFADWCADFGVNEDSRKDYATWKRCLAFSKKLQAFFTAAELEDLR